MNLKFQSYSVVKRRPTDGREVEMSTSSTHIVWRYVGDIAWTDLVELSTFKGAAGDDGNDGREVELSVVYNHLVWRYIGDETWIDLFELPADGNDGAPGTAGVNGNTPYIQGGYWYIDGVNTGVLATGTTGANGNTPYIQGGYWYINAVNTGVLATGTPGSPGSPGSPGTSSYVYVAYASTNTGTGWSLTPTNLLKYRAEIHNTTPLTPVAEDFSGSTWVKYIGDDGTDGGGGGSDLPDLHIDFLDLTEFVYNVPYGMKFTSVSSEGSAPTLSHALNTNLTRYTKFTVTPTAVGLVSIYGEYL
jgi:hypothetical protein